MGNIVRKDVTTTGNECQRSVNDFWSSILDNPTAVQQDWPIIEVLAAFMGNIISDDVTTT